MVTLSQLHKFLLVKDSAEFQKRLTEAEKKDGTDDDAIALDDDATCSPTPTYVGSCMPSAISLFPCSVRRIKILITKLPVP
jgi:hypothetical protein